MTKRFFRQFVVARTALALLLVGGGAPRLTSAQPTAAPAAVAPSGQMMPLRPGDALRVRVVREPDLSGEFMIDERGIVTLPLLGRVMASDVPADSLKARVIRGYEGLLSARAGASVVVTPLYRVHVVGAVRTPGLFTVDPTMTIADALGLAGGVSPAGRDGRVLLVRDGRRSGAPLARGTRLVDLALRSGDELYVPERGWLNRNPGVLIGGVSAVASLVWAFQRR